MKLKSLVLARAWQCFAFTCLTGAFATKSSARLPAVIPRICQDSIPSPSMPDSLKMLAVYTGTYIIPDDPDLQIVLEKGKLYGIPTSGNKHIMIRTAQHQFWVPDKEILMQFEMDSYGQVAKLQLSKGDLSTIATKKK